MFDLPDTMEDYISAKPSFALNAANDVHTVSSLLSARPEASGFARDELMAIREAIFPYGGSFFSLDIKFNGVPTGGQKLDIYTPLTGHREDSHLLSISKVAVSEGQSNYAVHHIQTNAVFPANRFDHVLKTAMTILRNSQPDKTSQPHNSYNG